MVYCAAEDIFDIYGEVNTKTWADLDNDKNPTKISNRIEKSILWASNEIDSLLRNSIYKIPFSTTGEEVPEDIKNIAGTLAGVWLYENRGVKDFDQVTGASIHRLGYQRKRAYETIRQILAGQRHLDAIKRVENYPRGEK